MTVTDADRAANDPVPFKLIDGRVMNLHYGFGGLRRIEGKFGSVKALMERIEDPLGPEFYEAMFCALLFGLWQSGITEDELEALLDPAEVINYGPALTDALVQAFPRQAQEMAAAASAEETSESPGPTVTTSPQSGSVVRTKRSGT